LWGHPVGRAELAVIVGRRGILVNRLCSSSGTAVGAAVRRALDEKGVVEVLVEVAYTSDSAVLKLDH